jgi:hypothetical protein
MCWHARFSKIKYYLGCPKGGLNQTEALEIMGIQKFKISRELKRKAGLRGGY